MDEFALNISIPSDHIDNIFGQFDRNIKTIENGMSISFILRDDVIKVVGEKERVEHGKIIIDELLALSQKGNIITAEDVN